MELIFKEGSLTYTKAFKDDASAEEVLIGAYELIAKVYSQQAVINANYRSDPDSLDIRND